MAEPYDFASLARADDSALEMIMRTGTTPDPHNLLGWEFRGYNVPFSAELIRSRKFKKGFFQPDNGRPGFSGYNVQVKQNGLSEPWLPKPKLTDPKRFGFFTVNKVEPAALDSLYPNALLLDYSQYPNKLHEGSMLRDYLVQVTEDNPDLYLGKAFFAIGDSRKGGTFFVLERYNPIQGTVTPNG